MATDMLLFRTASGVSVGQRCVGWTGEWPPPEEMWIATGEVTGMTQVFDPTEINRNVLELVQEPDSSIVVERFKRHRASELPDSVREDSHAFRGAEYLPIRTE